MMLDSMVIRGDASREISFDFWAGRQMTEDRTFMPLNQAIGMKADINTRYS